MFDTDFLDMMATIATYEPFTGRDLYADPSFGPTSTFPCHVTYKHKIVRNNSGEESVSTAQIQAPPPGFRWTVGDTTILVPTFSVDDQVILPLDGVSRRVLNINVYTDDIIASDIHHQSIDLT